MYSLLRNLLFNFDAEAVHHFSMDSLKRLSEVPVFQELLAKNFRFDYPSLHKQVFGLPFKNPVGLGAGFDKNGLYLRELETMGFGFIEVGTVTPLPQAGNDKPRLFRLPKDQAIINRMGFNNNGVKAVAEKLRATKRNIIVGGNIGKNKATTNEDAWKDYEICMNELFDCIDYFVVNVSSPNTPGLRELQEKSSLRKILSQLQNINQGRINTKPLLLKIAPDLTVGQLDDIIELAQEVKLNGLVATNTTISRENLQTEKEKVSQIGLGGLSGKPLKQKSTQIVQYISKQTNGGLPIIASGGIFTAEDAKEKLAAGASLIQVWTGFVYEGPAIVKRICEDLSKR
ncbi:quinone-dependent dihydroorotate dehydrogenase [Segetibacter sp.]|jgi:dihydroorotate dehydrogenase|uniref:quinone-dependent dihydroorotate dehydrogenase n=1 Tax=Segetibacter sp. TaxID=2231182 RepID=UPI002638E657|nr:quinone-dependent dihydroorotate dehydrogenase [Segetibacter sp.]MCW3081143.1 quinone-dependent dihydroorotate dehydrogenase [Segetibacter sp.]